MKGCTMERQELFDLIYKVNAWGSSESRSGAGSTLAATEHIRRELPALFSNFGVKSILDIPCGDMNWISKILNPELNYIGADIVGDLIDQNKRNYPNLDFRLLDIINSDLPEVDLIICRDCFFHFPLELIFEALRNIKRSKSKYLLTTHFVWRTRKNINIDLGKFFAVNFRLEPFNFPAPLETIIEGNSEWEPHLGTQKDRSLSLWRICDI